jgi:hypothetical protein
MMTQVMRTGLLALAVAIVILGVDTSDARACPNCKEAVSLSSEEASNMSSGYNWSVAFMLAVPFSMLGTGAFMIRRAVRLGALPEM